MAATRTNILPQCPERQTAFVDERVENVTTTHARSDDTSEVTTTHPRSRRRMRGQTTHPSHDDTSEVRTTHPRSGQHIRGHDDACEVRTTISGVTTTHPRSGRHTRDQDDTSEMRRLLYPSRYSSRRYLEHTFKTGTDYKRTSFRIVEVGARDGLQNEKKIIPTEDKISLIERLVDCGLKCVEATSFVSPKWIPQMSDHNEVISRVRKREGVSYPVLIPNMAGLNNAIKNGSVNEIAVFTAASESFSRKNTNCSMEESSRRVREVIKAATSAQLTVRGYISCVIACPYDGVTSPTIVAKITESLLDAGCYEVSLGDTIGVGSAGSVRRLLDCILSNNPVEQIAVHFHDTYGQALSNVLVAFDKGIRVADSSVAGLGGCPYAKGAAGNLATEDIVFMLDDLGVYTGIDLMGIVEVGNWICDQMGRENNSRVACAIRSKKSDL